MARPGLGHGQAMAKWRVRRNHCQRSANPRGTSGHVQVELKFRLLPTDIAQTPLKKQMRNVLTENEEIDVACFCSGSYFTGWCRISIK